MKKCRLVAGIRDWDSGSTKLYISNLDGSGASKLPIRIHDSMRPGRKRTL